MTLHFFFLFECVVFLLSLHECVVFIDFGNDCCSMLSLINQIEIMFELVKFLNYCHRTLKVLIVSKLNKKSTMLKKKKICNITLMKACLLWNRLNESF